MRVSVKADLVAMEVIHPLLKEGNDLTNIIAKSVVTAKRGKSKVVLDQELEVESISFINLHFSL